MTDYTKLIERLRYMGKDGVGNNGMPIANEAAAAIEALQGEVAHAQDVIDNLRDQGRACSLERDALLDRVEKAEKDTERLVWAMHNMSNPFGRHEVGFSQHVLEQGSTGDINDCRTYIDAAMKASMKELLADLRSRINPAYQDVRGTESYERKQCADAIEALQGEVERLTKNNGLIYTDVLQLRNERDALQAENERLKRDVACHDDMSNEIAYLRKERDALADKLGELQRQKPVTWRYEIEDGVYRYCRHKADTDMQAEFGVLNPVALYAAPKALEPVNVWQLAVDDELVSAHLGVANPDATLEQAKAKVHELICWSIQVDKDLAAPKALEPLTDEQILEAIRNAPKMQTTYAGWVRDQRIAWGRAILAAAHGITKGTPT